MKKITLKAKIGNFIIVDFSWRDFFIHEKRMLVDNEGRKHCPDGPSYIENGKDKYFWHDVSIPEWIIMRKELISPEKILKEPNSEVRRVMTEIYGFRRFGEAIINSGKAKLINEQNVWGEPVKYYHYQDGGVTLGFIHVINGTTEQDGTKHEFILTVKADNDNAEEAVFDTYPDLMEELEGNPEKWEILRKSVRS